MVWVRKFEETVRLHLYSLPAESPLDPEESLRDLGLDSLDAVSLMVRLEEAFGITFDDRDMNAETFETAAALWSVVRSHVAADGRAAELKE